MNKKNIIKRAIDKVKEGKVLPIVGGNQGGKIFKKAKDTVSSLKDIAKFAKPGPVASKGMAIPKDYFTNTGKWGELTRYSSKARDVGKMVTKAAGTSNKVGLASKAAKVAGPVATGALAAASIYQNRKPLMQLSKGISEGVRSLVKGKGIKESATRAVDTLSGDKQKSKSFSEAIGREKKGQEGVEREIQTRKHYVPDHMKKDYDAGTLPKLPDLSIKGTIESIKNKVFKRKSK